MKKVLPAGSTENPGHYTPGIISNGLLYVSGQLSVDPVTREVAQGGIEEHTRLALGNVERVLKEAGLSRGDVVQCRVYVTDIDSWDQVNRAYAEFFGAHKPARVVVPVPRLHFGCLVEIEAIAEVREQ
jgi:2-iminobutanoate/2-iminopropanoate deaminase